MSKKTKVTPKQACQLAIKAAGGITALSRELSKLPIRRGGITKNAICQWRTVPPKWVIAVEQIIDGKVTRHQMQPHVFGASQ